MSASNSTETILFVDDNQALQRSVERLLRVEGFQVILADDGTAALNILNKEGVPDLIISDVAMPNMDGFELFEEVRQRAEWLNVPFIFLTARDQMKDLRQGYELGADDYLIKPFEQERLLLVIRSKLKRRAELQEHLNVQQAAIDAAKRELSMMVAHELRTPLVSITMVTDILSREFDRMEVNQAKEMVEMMHSGSVRLNRLVEQMVMYVQLTSGALLTAIQSHLRPSYMREAVIGAVDRARQFSYRQQDIPLRYDEHDPDAQIMGDLAALKHALAELLSNAMAFSTPKNEIEVVQWSADHRVWLTITDQGPGIEPEHLARVFEPFYQANRTHYEQQGIGIGLALSQGIIQVHGGTLELKSRVGVGTRATVSLPIWTKA
ncbi:MAG TPA: response regulator [Aggregatilineaceae bacterium]|nr:response regulator [Aggregatilineaceae bacterium]